MNHALYFPNLDLDTDWRIETKYRIPLRTYLALRNAITPYLAQDPYTQAAPGQRYLVRSLYYDTADYRSYHEKVDGNCDRVKFRLRSYSDQAEASPDIRVEMKVRKGNVMEKYGCFVPYPVYEVFTHSGHWPTDQEPVLIEFERYLALWRLVPKTLVQYRREGYSDRAREGIRLTFDQQVMSAAASTLFPVSPFFRRQYEQQVVLEIKHRQQLPKWLERLIKAYDLKVVANSKYAMAVETAQHDVILPAWRQV